MSTRTSPPSSRASDPGLPAVAGSFVDIDGDRLVVLAASVARPTPTDEPGASCPTIAAALATRAAAGPGRGPTSRRPADERRGLSPRATTILGWVVGRPASRRDCPSPGRVAVERPLDRARVTRSVPTAPRSHPIPWLLSATTAGCPGSPPTSSRRWFAERGEPGWRGPPGGDAVWGRSASRSRRSGRCRLPCAPRSRRLPLRYGRRTRRFGCPTAGLSEKGLHRLSDGTLIESVSCTTRPAARCGERPHAVHLESGRLRGRLPFCRDR